MTARSPAVVAAFALAGLVGAGLAVGCTGLLGINAPLETSDASPPEAYVSAQLEASPFAAQDQAASTNPSAPDTSTVDEGSADSSPLVDALPDGELVEADAPGCDGVCVSGTTEPCGMGGDQTCNAECRWGPCSVPNTVGCSDGVRDGLLDFTGIAGCLGDWGEASMRAPRTGVACGNDLALRCGAPADLCALGWHVCGTPPYGPTDISDKITNVECTSETGGAFAAALGDVECEPCSSTGFGAVCCGTPCVQQNGSCVWSNATPWVGVISGHTNLCSDVINTYPTTMGALCCID